MYLSTFLFCLSKSKQSRNSKLKIIIKRFDTRLYKNVLTHKRLCVFALIYINKSGSLSKKNKKNKNSRPIKNQNKNKIKINATKA